MGTLTESPLPVNVHENVRHPSRLCTYTQEERRMPAGVDVRDTLSMGKGVSTVWAPDIMLDEDSVLAAERQRKILAMLRIDGNTPVQVKKDIERLVLKYWKSFTVDGTAPPITQLVQHRIDRGDSNPINQPLRRTSPAQKAIIAEETKKMLANKTISPSHSPLGLTSCASDEKGRIGAILCGL